MLTGFEKAWVKAMNADRFKKDALSAFKSIKKTPRLQAGAFAIDKSNLY